MAYLLINICTKNYWNWTTIVEIIVGGWVVSFLRHSVHYRGLLHLTEFCKVQNSLCIQVLHSARLAALLHGTRVVGVSQTLRR